MRYSTVLNVYSFWPIFVKAFDWEEISATLGPFYKMHFHVQKIIMYSTMIYSNWSKMSWNSDLCILWLLKKLFYLWLQIKMFYRNKYNLLHISKLCIVNFMGYILESQSVYGNFLEIWLVKISGRWFVCYLGKKSVGGKKDIKSAICNV